jgi:hypothetical protein
MAKDYQCRKGDQWEFADAIKEYMEHQDPLHERKRKVDGYSLLLSWAIQNADYEEIAAAIMKEV